MTRQNVRRQCAVYRQAVSRQAAIASATRPAGPGAASRPGWGRTVQGFAACTGCAASQAFLGLGLDKLQALPMVQGRMTSVRESDRQRCPASWARSLWCRMRGMRWPTTSAGGCGPRPFGSPQRSFSARWSGLRRIQGSKSAAAAVAGAAAKDGATSASRPSWLEFSTRLDTPTHINSTAASRAATTLDSAEGERPNMSSGGEG